VSDRAWSGEFVKVLPVLTDGIAIVALMWKPGCREFKL